MPAIMYKKLLAQGGVPAHGTTTVELTDATIGPLLKAWLLVVTNQDFWDPASTNPPSDSDLQSYAAKIGVDPMVLTLVMGMAQSRFSSFSDVTDAFSRVALSAGYGTGGQGCPIDVGSLGNAVKTP